MNIQVQASNLLGGNNSILGSNGLKSTQEKLQRQAARDNQISFLENQKSNLKNMECNSLEEISRKLDMFHTYESQIAAVKEQYNSSQMRHVLDEAEERGEKIAEAAEKYAPKTPEERREEITEEALGMDDSKSGLSEIQDTSILEELAESTEELSDNLSQENMSEYLSEELTEESADFGMENTPVSYDEQKASELNGIYHPIDIRV